MEKTLAVSVRSFSETDTIILRLLEENREGFIRKDGRIWLRKDGKVYAVEDTPEGNALIRAAVGSSRTETAGGTEEDTWKEALRGNADPTKLKKAGIQDHVPRCVILFRPLQEPKQRIQREMIPVERDDRVLETENGDTALILNLKKRTPEEIGEYAAAAAETLESEAGISCLAGIGRTAGTIGELADSRRDAEKAIETGIRHKLPGRVYVYDRQRLEHLMDLIPEAEAEVFRHEVIPPRAEKVLTEETLETIRAFFRNDLNLSTTARQLFIHRNTLLYRMEKVRKATGLDLRKFEDAAVFRMLMTNNGNKE